MSSHKEPRVVYNQQPSARGSKHSNFDTNHSEPADPSTLPRLTAGTLAEISVRATRFTASIPERIGALKDGLTQTRMPANIQRNITDIIFKAQGSVSHSKRFTTAAAPKNWTSYATRTTAGKREIFDSRLRTAEKQCSATRREVENLDHLVASVGQSYLNKEFDVAFTEGADSSASSRSVRETPVSPYKERSSAKQVELEQQSARVTELREQQEELILAIARGTFDDDTNNGAKQLLARDVAASPAAESSQRQMLWDTLIMDLLGIATAKN